NKFFLAPIELNPTYLPNSLMSPLWSSLGPIDRDICQFSKTSLIVVPS
ncbi:19272_t:CDS:1, partial [Rhizophagus irregularis]